MDPSKQAQLKELLDQTLEKMGLEPVNPVTGDYSLDLGIRIDTIPQTYEAAQWRITINSAEPPAISSDKNDEYKNIDIKNENKMKITKKQLRRIIKESLNERANPAMAEIERELRHTLAEYIDTYMMSMSMNPGDAADRKRIYQKLESIASAIMG